MAIGKGGIVIMMVATIGCHEPVSIQEIGVPGARPVAYEAIRDASGVLGYAESLLGPEIATKYQVPVGPGSSYVEPQAVAGAWELPLGTKPDAVADALRARGALERVLDRSDGQLWIADYRPHAGPPVRLLLIDGAHRAFETRAVPEVRPGPHVYLIAYRT